MKRIEHLKHVASDRRGVLAVAAVMVCTLPLLLSGCGEKAEASPHFDEPPPVQVEQAQDASSFKVDRPDQFPLVTVSEHRAAPELNVTGSVSADVSRNVPVISLASGRVVDVRVRLGDTVRKGEVLMRVQSVDVAQAFSEYRQALADQALAQSQLDRATLLYGKGAIAKKDLDVSQNAADKTRVTVETALEHLRVLGADVNHPSSVVDVYAPASGVITDQQATAGAGVQALSSSNPFTIADLSHVWILCDVYENDLPSVHLGEYADVHLNAYPNVALKGRIGNISPILDPATRTAKVRLEVPNPGMLRFGMFVTATFHGLSKEAHAVVPASAILHLHDRDWVYAPAADSGRFYRVEVTSGAMLPDHRQEVIAGLQPGQRVVANALALQATVEQ